MMTELKRDRTAEPVYKASKKQSSQSNSEGYLHVNVVILASQEVDVHTRRIVFLRQFHHRDNSFTNFIP